MTNVFLELLSMASSMTTEFLRFTHLDWIHSILLRHLRTMLWQPPKTLNDMPYDVVFVLSHHLSVRDLCNLRATSKRLSNLVRDRSIWLLALHDILEVRPIPRLTFSLDEMNLDEIMTATLRLAALDRKIRGVDPITSFTLTRFLDVNLLPVPLPGGRHFATLQDSERKLMVHDWDADTLAEGRLLVPPSKHPIYLWRAVPVSSTAINVAVVSLEELTERDYRGKPLPRTHVSIYCCDVDKGSYEQIDYFYVDPKIWTLFFDTTRLAILWDDWLQGQFAYVRMYRKGFHTPIMSLKDPRCPRQGSITIISQGYFITVNGNGTYTRVFTLPDMHPVAGAHVVDAPVYQPSIWRTVQGGDALLVPRVSSLLLGPDQRPSNSPPPKFIVWTGRHPYIVAPSPDAGITYDVHSQHMWPDMPHSMGCDAASFMGTFSGAHYLPERLVMLFAIPVAHPTSRGAMRLDADSSLGDSILVTRLSCPGLQDHEFLSYLSYDEESGRLYMAYADMETPESRIVLAHL